MVELNIFNALQTNKPSNIVTYCYTIDTENATSQLPNLIWKPWECPWSVTKWMKVTGEIKINFINSQIMLESKGLHSFCFLNFRQVCWIPERLCPKTPLQG